MIFFVKKIVMIWLSFSIMLGCFGFGNKDDADSNYVIAKISGRVIKIKKQAIQDIGNWPKDFLEIITVNPSGSTKKIYSPDQKVAYSRSSNNSAWKKTNVADSLGPRTWYEARFLPGKDGYFVAEFWEGYLPGRKLKNSDWAFGEQPPKDILLLRLDTIQFNGSSGEEIHYGGWSLMSQYGWWKPLSPLAVSDMNHMYISKDEKTMLFPAQFDAKDKDTVQLFDIGRAHNKWKNVSKKSIDYSKFVSLATWWEKSKDFYTTSDN